MEKSGLFSMTIVARFILAHARVIVAIQKQRCTLLLNHRTPILSTAAVTPNIPKDKKREVQERERGREREQGHG